MGSAPQTFVNTGTDVCLTGDFSHIDSQISPGSLPDYPTVLGGVDSVFSSSSRTIIFMDKLIESFNRI